jgi:hypothetical protein
MSTKLQAITYYIQTVASSAVDGIEVFKGKTKYVAHIDVGHTNPSNTIIKKHTMWPAETIDMWLIEAGYSIPDNPPTL